MAQSSDLSNFDPICGRRLNPNGPRSHRSEYKARMYFFCSERCRRAFERHAERLRLTEVARAGALLTPGRVAWGLA